MNVAQADHLIEGVTEWANRERSIRAAALVGSWARGTATPESDLDIVADGG